MPGRGTALLCARCYSAEYRAKKGQPRKPDPERGRRTVNLQVAVTPALHEAWVAELPDPVERAEWTRRQIMGGLEDRKVRRSLGLKPFGTQDIG